MDEFLQMPQMTYPVSFNMGRMNTGFSLLPKVIKAAFFPRAMPRSILIVEDSEDDAFLLKRALIKCGIRNSVRSTVNAADAISYLDSDEPCPGIIFLDLK